MMNYTYILRCADDSLYCGWTNHLEKRIRAHNEGKGAKYTRARRPVTLAYYEVFETKEEAMSREAAIKKLNRKDQLLLIEAQPENGRLRERQERVTEKVHSLYYDLDLNCARTMLRCLGEVFQFQVGEDLMEAAVGLHGAGGFRAQCGLVEGALLFIGLFGAGKGLEDEKRSALCYEFAERFTEIFGSLRCEKLRPGGFRKDDPPHRCESLTVSAILYVCRFIEETMEDVRSFSHL